MSKEPKEQEVIIITRKTLTRAQVDEVAKILGLNNWEDILVLDDIIATAAQID